MTDVYQSVSTTNEVEDRYARNEVARRALLGPLSIVIKCLGFDSTYSLFKAETRRRVIAWIATPLSLIGIFVLLGNFSKKMEEIDGFGSLSWKWGETLILFFLAAQSVASAIFLMRRTSALFFLEYYEAWSECARLGEKENKEEKQNGDVENGGSLSPLRLSVPPSSSARPILVALAFLFFGGASIASSLKYALYNGHNSVQNETASSLLLDKVHTLEPLVSLWGSLLTASALSVCGVLHGILQLTIDELNKDLKAASESKTLSSRLDSFSVRYQAVLIFARVLSTKLGTYTTFCFKTAVAVNFAVMFMSLAYKGEPAALGNVCVVLWTVVAIAPHVVLLLQPAEVQNKLNETNEIIIADKEIWNGDAAMAQQAQLLLSKRKYTDTTISVLKCLKLTPWVANGLMLVAPIIGGSLTIIKLFIMKP